MTTENSIIIFHRSKQNAEESLTNQQAFLESCRKNFTPARIIDYTTGDYLQAKKISELIRKQSSSKIIVIINSPLSQKECYLQYDMYCFSIS